MGDSWKKIDYFKEASSWMEPLKRGKSTNMVEIPANWDVSPSPKKRYKGY
jgi:hypothetical protein